METQMKSFLVASLIVVAACSDEADIGTSSQPITCMQGTAGGMSGSVDYQGQTYAFSKGVPTINRDADGALTVLSMSTEDSPNTPGNNLLRFHFLCGQPTVATYDVVASNQPQLACPLAVASGIVGAIEYLPVTGELIIDEMSTCVAGRFSVDATTSGSIDGWFRVPL
jgi:hypothetical protein